MNEFDIKALTWDQNPMIWNRANAIAKEILNNVPLNKNMTALEFGAGTGVTSFILKDSLKEITLMDNSAEMYRIMQDKIRKSGVTNLKAVDFNLEVQTYNNGTFDFIFNQMVLHHITDIPGIIKKFYDLLNPGGYLALADLYPEDGSFHGEGFTGHRGFDPVEMSETVSAQGFTDVNYRKCYTMNKQINDSTSKQFDIFLLIARKPAK